ncbi:hypothetical protein Q7C36_000044 [Tachysurus vachellii]|uniref:UBC core domain-containing protein n=1 Tax=Tachysurus vachellii TaxID=175792 RepID=A0AA88T8P5_TACVA|nr:hypothetical protein Q7C36_000044 [Tachysurus vachellii]
MVCMQGRMQKEWLALQNDPPPGMTLKGRRVQNTITEWVIELKGLPRTLYEGQKFQLLFTFSSRFPFEPPQVMFTGENIPVNPFVDSNGHIPYYASGKRSIIHLINPQRRESVGSTVLNKPHHQDWHWHRISRQAVVLFYLFFSTSFFPG